MSLLHGHNDTIAAIATPPGRGGIAVVKISGPDAVALVRGLLSSPPDPFTTPRRMVHVHILDGDTPIDDALVCFMPGPHSYTGEDVVEIQTHGGYSAADTVLSLLISRGVRQASPGEFTRRAFLNGRLDLAQAEGVMQVVEADNRAALTAAQQLLEGGFSAQIESMIESLTTVLAHLEAAIDFSEDVADDSPDSFVAETLDDIQARLTAMIDSHQVADRIRHGITVVLAGPVNTGKSSLFNALLGTQRALVNSEPGTTRDWIDAHIEIDGIPFNLIDTAGFRETAHDVEQAGIRETARLTESADIILRLHHAPDDLPEAPVVRSDHQIIVHVASKADLHTDLENHQDMLFVSALTGNGIPTLKNRLSTLGQDLIGNREVTAPVLVDRHHHLLSVARDHIAAAQSSAESFSEEILTLEIHSAISSLEEILGRTIDTDVLDTIFASFCIGK